MKLRDEELIREVRAMRPEIDPDFGAELDAWAAEGFPSAEPEAKRPRRRALRLRPLLPRLAVAASVLLALVVSVSLLSTVDGGSDDSGGDSAGEGSIESAPSPSSGQDLDGGGARESLDEGASGDAIEPAPTTLPPAPPVPPREQLKPGQERIQERSASMTLSADPDEVAEVADGVVEVTERYDGIVVSSEVDTGADRARASFDLRIPTQNLQAALADLSDLGSVVARNEGTLDITAPFVSAEERFADAKATVDAVVRRLGEAGSSDEIASIRAQLSVARSELAGARSELAALKQRADFSRLSLAISSEGDADGWSLGDAFDDALSVLEDIGGATLVALAVIVPLGILVAALWFGLGAARRRARERALDD